MSGHTKGPWVVGNQHSMNGVFTVNGDLVANTHGASRNFDREAQIAEQDANARLIAAAPEMSEALKAMIEEHGERDFITNELLPLVSQRHDVGLAMQAIAKAEGQS